MAAAFAVAEAAAAGSASVVVAGSAELRFGEELLAALRFVKVLAERRLAA